MRGGAELSCVCRVPAPSPLLLPSSPLRLLQSGVCSPVVAALCTVLLVLANHAYPVWVCGSVRAPRCDSGRARVAPGGVVLGVFECRSIMSSPLRARDSRAGDATPRRWCFADLCLWWQACERLVPCLSKRGWPRLLHLGGGCPPMACVIECRVGAACLLEAALSLLARPCLV